MAARASFRGKAASPDAFWYGAPAPLFPGECSTEPRADVIDWKPAWRIEAARGDPGREGDRAKADAGAALSIGFRAPDFLRHLPEGHPVHLQLVYRDAAPGTFEWRCDAHGRAEEAGLPPLCLEGNGEWLSAHWTVSNPRFEGGLDGADLKLESRDASSLTLVGLFAETEQPVSGDARPREGVPQGDVHTFSFDRSRIYPGTVREIAVYVPKQYGGAAPACVWVDQDGMGWNDAVVFDNLIAAGEVPVMIAMGILPGRVPDPRTGDTKDPRRPVRVNRSFEYDTLSGDYGRFLVEEVFPAVEALKLPDGRAIRLSRRAADCGIGGASSGGICALNAAWQNPAAFSRVFSGIGSYENLRGGDRLPTLFRKTEPKPIRVFLQAGENDLDTFAGDWWLANVRMKRALAFAGYEHAWAAGDGGHNNRHAQAIFPEIQRFLWKGWPEPVGTGKSKNQILEKLLLPGEGWREVWTGNAAPDGLAANAQGEVVFGDGEGRLFCVRTDGRVTPFAASALAPGSGAMPEAGRRVGDGLATASPLKNGAVGATNGHSLAFGSDGRLYRLEPERSRIFAWDAAGGSAVLASGIQGRGIAAVADGRFYVSESAKGGEPNRIWLYAADGSRCLVDSGDEAAGPLAADSRHGFLYRGDGGSWVTSFQIQPDGTLRHKQRFIQLDMACVPASAGVAALCWADENTWAATQLGLQIANFQGIVEAMIPVPNGRATGIAFGGPGRETLLVASGSSVFARKIRRSQSDLPEG